MNLIKFIDNRFQELRLLEQDEDRRKEYSVTRDSETLALQGLLKGFRTFLKWVMLPKVVFHYLAVCMGWLKRPEPVLIQKLEAQQAKELEAKALEAETKVKDIKKKATKLGMAPRQDEYATDGVLPN